MIEMDYVDKSEHCLCCRLCVCGGDACSRDMRDMKRYFPPNYADLKQMHVLDFSDNSPPSAISAHNQENSSDLPCVFFSSTKSEDFVLP